MSRVLVTGGTGFVGANLARRLLADGHEVHLLVREGSPNLWRLRDVLPGLRLHEVDLRDEGGVASAMAEVRPRQVFHLAVYGAYPSQTGLRQMVSANMLATINVVEAALAAGSEAIVNTGSSSEYGYKDHAPGEAELPEPNSAYAVTKLSATLYCQFIARSRQVRIPTLRLYSVYGPYEEPARLIPALVARGLRGELPPLVRPDIARDYVYAADVVDAYVLAAGAETGPLDAVYNVGTGVQTTLAEAVAAARRVMAIAAEPVWGSMDQRSWDTTVWVSDPARIRQDLGWQARTSFETGLRRTVEWLRAHPELLALYERRQGGGARP